MPSLRHLLPALVALVGSAHATPVADATNAVAVDLYQELAKTPGNMAFSPASIELALAMTAAGAKGETLKQMRQVLHLPADLATFHADAGAQLKTWNTPTEGVELKVVNRLFGDINSTFVPQFLSVTGDNYGARLEQIPMGAEPEKSRLHINKWVAQQTRNRIKDLLPKKSITKDSRLVLTNAVYFLGKWADAFDPGDTAPFPFYAPSGEKTAPMMRRTQTERVLVGPQFKLLELGYKGATTSMWILLPNERTGLAALEKTITHKQLSDWGAEIGPAKVNVVLPRFKIDPAESTELKTPFERLGMALPFGMGADFTGMFKPKSPADALRITDIFHKAMIEVDESGTEAAAATAVVMGRKGAAPRPSKPIIFRADHPFMFLIRDNRSGTILFMGRVTDPTLN